MSRHCPGLYPDRHGHTPIRGVLSCPVQEENVTENKFNFDHEIDRTIFEFNEKLSSNYEMKDIPHGFTHKTLELEESFTKKANEGDIEGFREILNMWRMAWLSLMVKKVRVYH